MNDVRDSRLRQCALVIAAVSGFLAPFMSSSINLALPSIQAEFKMDTVTLGWVATTYILAAAMFLVPFGKVADIYGRKKIFVLGVTIYTIASLPCAVSTTGAFLIVSRILQGFGAALIFATSVAILTSVYPLSDRGKALGIVSAATYLGLSLGPFLGGLMTQHLGWRSIFYANLPLGLAILVLVFKGLKGEWAEEKGEKLDYFGSILLSAGLVAVMYGLSLLPSISGTWLIAAGIAALIGFAWWEGKARHPVLNTSLFRNTVFAFSNLAALINYCATFAVTFLLSQYLQYIRGYDPQTSGFILVAQPVMMTIFSPYAGKLSDRIESRIVASIGMGLAVVGLGLLAFLDRATPAWFIIMSLLILGFGFALFSSPNTNAVMSSVEKRFYGVASATLGTMRLTGQMLSIGMATLIIVLLAGRTQIVPEIFPQFVLSVRVSFGVFSGLCLLGVFASMARGNLR
jgi:EmrB/QacA subfamily drug resistance transporter